VRGATTGRRSEGRSRRKRRSGRWRWPCTACPSRGAMGAAALRLEAAWDAARAGHGRSLAAHCGAERRAGRRVRWSAALAAELQAERHRRETAENLALNLFNVAAEERKSLLAEEREGRASDAGGAGGGAREAARGREALQWPCCAGAPDERHALEALGAEVEAQRRELQLSDNWREFNMRVKPHEASLELAERVDALEGVHCALEEELAARGLASLWETAHSMVAETKEKGTKAPGCRASRTPCPSSSVGAAWLEQGRVLGPAGSAAPRQEAFRSQERE